MDLANPETGRGHLSLSLFLSFSPTPSLQAAPAFIFPAALFKVKREYQESLIGSN